MNKVLKRLLMLLSMTVVILFAYPTVYAEITAPPSEQMADSPDITRSEFCDYSYNLLHERLNIEMTDSTDVFADTDKKEICTLYELGVIDGRGDDTFDPDGLITREEAARILCSLMDVMGIEDRVIVNEQFKDFDTVSDWAKEYVDRVGRNEIMEGNGNGYNINGPDGGGNSPTMNLPKDTFHLYDSDFGPHSNYTVWQTQQTLYNLSCKKPEMTGEEEVREISDIKLYKNDQYLWAEKDGQITFSEPNGAYRIADIEGGRHILAYKRGIYNLDTGERVFKVEHAICGMNSVFITTFSYFSLAKLGLTPFEVYCVYDYNGNIITTQTLSYGSTGPTIKNITDENDNKYYIFNSKDNSVYLTGKDTINPIVYGKKKIWTDIECDRFICTVEENGEEIYQFYDFNGNKIYEGKQEVQQINKDIYAVKNESDDGFIIYSMLDDTEQFRIKGDKLSVIRGWGIKTTSSETSLKNMYSFDNSFRVEGLNSVGTLKKDDGEEYLSLKTDVRGFSLYDSDFNKILTVDNRDYQKVDNDILVVFLRGEDISPITLYNLKDLSIIAEFEGKWSYQITKNYIMIEIDGENRLYNYHNGKYVVLGYYDEDGKIKLNEMNDIVRVMYFPEGDWYAYDNAVAELYDSSLTKLYSGIPLSQWTSKYIEPYKSDKLLDIHGNDTGIEAKHILFHTVNGRKLVIVWNGGKDYSGNSIVYDYDTLEYLFTIKGEADDNDSDKYIKTRSGLYQCLYYDENGNQIEPE